MADSFFTSDDGEWFRPTDVCRGPWDPAACHAGPPTGLLARASERLLPGQRLARLTVELTRPIPMAGFRIAGEIVRSGKTVGTSAMAILDADDRPVASARGMHLGAAGPTDLPSTPYDAPLLADARPDRFPVTEASHGLPMFALGVETRYPPGHGPDPGPTVMWMRTVPLLPTEDPSGFQRLCPLADCGNAVSRNAEFGEFAFMNTDLTLAVHREPVGEWVGTNSVSRWEPDGTGLSDSVLFDEHGACGRALQTLVVRPFA